MRSNTNSFDVVITGSGLGGLLCAVMLAKEGMKVCVLEKNKQIGGCLQTFSLHKTVFDSCVHYIGGLGEGHTLHKIFSYAGIMGKLKLKALDTNGFDRIAFAEEDISYPHAVGMKNFAEQLHAYFPKEKKALEDYVQTISTVGDCFPLYRLKNGDATAKNAVSHWSLTDTLEKITGNSLLGNVLAGNNLLYAGEKGKTPFYVHALVSESYMHSAHKLVRGSSQIAKLLWKELQAHGGVIYKNTEVVKLAEENGVLTYAEDKNGQRFYGKQFIANIHPQILLPMLDTNLLRPAYRNRVNNLAQTTSAFMLNLVLKPQSVPIRNHNLYWHKSQDVWRAADYYSQFWPENYALYFTESEVYEGYAESLSVLAYMRFDEVQRWTHTKNYSGAPGKRGETYTQFKEAYSEKLLQQVYKRLPELKGHITAQSVATPLTYRDYTGAPEGALYGILKDVNKPHETQIALRTKIPNLLFTGQNVNLHGVLGVSITAVATCGELMGGSYLLEKLNGLK